MKKYLFFLPLIASCNSLGKSNVIPEGINNQEEGVNSQQESSSLNYVDNKQNLNQAEIVNLILFGGVHHVINLIKQDSITEKVLTESNNDDNNIYDCNPVLIAVLNRYQEVIGHCYSGANGKK